MKTKCLVQHLGTIEIKNGLIVADPCYGKDDIVGDMDNGVMLKNDEVNPGIYDCYVGWVNKGSYGNRIAFMEIVEDGARFSLDGGHIGYAGVDSGTMMMGDSKEWEKHHSDDSVDDDWYNTNVVERAFEDSYLFDEGFSFLSSSGWGDGCYPVYGKKDVTDKFNRVIVEFISPLDEYGDYDEYDFLDFLSAEDKVNFADYD